MEVSENIKEFVRTHANDDVNVLRLKYSGNKATLFGFDIEFALTQIEARRKAQKKLPSYIDNDKFLFPSITSEEQATNEEVAKFHASLINAYSSILDLTAGLGIDDFEFCKAGLHVTTCEIEQSKCNILQHNAGILDISDKLTIMNCDSTEYVQKCTQKFDVVFADPARRNASGGRIHALSDCQPNVLELLSTISTFSSRILIKSSPLLDLSLIQSTINELSHLYVVCVKGECKEVLIDISKDSSFTGVTVIDLDKDKVISSFHTDSLDSIKIPQTSYCNRKKASAYQYLYEPNAGIMKTGAWTSLIEKYPDLYKADVNTHIFLSDTVYLDFPGRIMQIIYEPDKKALKNIKGSQINIVSRNHPLSAPQIAKKYSVIAGSDTFLYAFRYRIDPTFLITKLKKQ